MLPHWRGRDPDAVDCCSLFVQQRHWSAEEVASAPLPNWLTAGADDVVTSAQSAARMLGRRLPAGAAVLVVGTDALAAEVRAVGLTRSTR